MVEQPRHAGEDYWSALYRRRWIIILVTMLSAFFTSFISLALTPLYQASARFYIPTDSVLAASAPQPALIRAPGMREQAKTYVAVLESRDAHLAVADQLEERTLADVVRAADFDVSPASSLVIYVRDKDPAVAKQMVELFVEYFKSFHALRLNTAIRMVEKPFVTQTPVFPMVILNTLIGTMGGVLLGIIYGLFLDYLQVRALAQKLGQFEDEEWIEEAVNEELRKRDKPHDRPLI